MYTRTADAKEDIIEGGRQTYTNPDGSERKATHCILSFTALDGGRIYFQLDHQSVKVTDKYGGSGKMTIEHNYKCRSIGISPTDGNNKTIQL